MQTIFSTVTRYTSLGVAFGAMFPAGGYAFDVVTRHKQVISYLDAIIANPIQGIVAMAPMVLGGAFYFIGRTQQRLELQLKETEVARQAMWSLANRDSLTGYGNRHKLMEDLNEILHKAHPESCSVMLIDLDKFKFINDTLGHGVGDELLCAFSKRVASCFDGAQKFYRIGGDEFVVLHCNSRSSMTPEDLAKRLISLFDKPFEIGGTQVIAGGSVGIAAMSPKDADGRTSLARADLALYEAKAAYGNAYMRYTPSMANSAHERMNMERDLQRALANDEFYLEYQPIMGMQSSKVRGFEALLRWKHPERGVILPDRFIPFAEVSGLIGKIGHFVLLTACKEAKKWPSPLSVSVNVSVEEFKNRNFYEQVVACLDESGLPPGRLILEITESVFTDDMSLMRSTFMRLKDLGVRFALDDFGTGYSSINHLRQLSLDYLKLDKSFIDRITSDKREEELVKNIIELGRLFRLTTTIEGVETMEQMELLKKQGVNEAQGYLIGRPMAASRIPEMLEAVAKGADYRVA